MDRYTPIISGFAAIVGASAKPVLHYLRAKVFVKAKRQSEVIQVQAEHKRLEIELQIRENLMREQMFQEIRLEISSLRERCSKLEMQLEMEVNLKMAAMKEHQAKLIENSELKDTIEELEEKIKAQDDKLKVVNQDLQVVQTEKVKLLEEIINLRNKLGIR